VVPLILGGKIRSQATPRGTDVHPRRRAKYPTLLERRSVAHELAVELEDARFVLLDQRAGGRELCTCFV
jgi:hypothetical protein